MNTQRALEHAADRLPIPERERPGRKARLRDALLAEQVLRMHERDHPGQAKFCDIAECCRTAAAGG